VIASALFSVYLSQFASYNKAWGSLAAVVIMLTWLWLGGVALLFGAEVDAELERRRGFGSGPPDIAPGSEQTERDDAGQERPSDEREAVRGS
jgi:membrane protein